MIKKTLLLISLCTIGVLHSNFCCAEVSDTNPQVTEATQQHYLQSQYYAPAQQIYIPSGTPIRAYLDETIDADDVREGDEVFLRVAQPVKVEGVTVIEANTQISAQVMDRENNCMFGIPGKLTIGNYKIKLSNGNDMYLSGLPITRIGQHRYWTNFIAFFLLAPMIFVKGDDAKINDGYQQMLYTNGDVYLQI